MEILEFTNKMEKALKEYYGENAEVRIHKVYKNNGLLLYGICVLENGKNIAPTIYLNSFHKAYEEGESFGVLFRRVIEITEENQLSKSLDVDFFLDYEKVKKRLVLRLIHLNENKELLKSVPYQEFMDLAVVCYCILENDEIGSGAILIHKHHVKAWEIEEEVLFQDAFVSSPRIEPCQIMKMREMIKDILSENILQEAHSLYGDEAENMIPGMLEHLANEMEQVEVPMYVLTNKKRYYGAACIVYPNILEEIGDLLQEDYYIIPSSVHEILFLPAGKCIDSEALNSIIEDVNRTQVEDEDWLSDHTYLYQREQKKLLSIPTKP